MQQLEDHDLVALGRYGSWRKRDMLKLSAEMPVFRSLDDARLVLTQAMLCPRLAVLILRGSVTLDKIPRAQHNLILEHIANLLPRSHVVCLNLGEFVNIPQPVAKKLLSGLKHSFVGNLFLEWDTQPQWKAAAKEILKANKRKWGYRMQLADEDAWKLLEKGCNAWLQPTAMGRQYALAYSDGGLAARGKQNYTGSSAPDDGTRQCKRACKSKRCRGLSKRRLRCCLCTRDESGRCHHHRR